MKLLLFSDLHNDLDAARRLVEMAADADVVIGAGDFCSVHRNLAACLEVLRVIKKPAVLVAGNNETTDELIAACRGWPSAHVLHGSGITISGVDFYGIGGGVPITPFGAWSYDFTEADAARLLSNCPSGCILVSHSPPKGAVDVASEGKSLGSTAVRAAIERVKPVLVVCGHIHGSAGRQAFMGVSPVVNAGPAGVEWELKSVRLTSPPRRSDVADKPG
jgi:Icc-related predicted phosphoesterase